MADDTEKTLDELKLELEYLRGEVYILRHFMAGLTAYQTHPPYLKAVALWNYAWLKKYQKEYPHTELGAIPEGICQKAYQMPEGQMVYGRERRVLSSKE